MGHGCHERYYFPKRMRFVEYSCLAKQGQSARMCQIDLIYDATIHSKWSLERFYVYELIIYPFSVNFCSMIYTLVIIDPPVSDNS